jgi:hypothetical protein
MSCDLLIHIEQLERDLLVSVLSALQQVGIRCDADYFLPCPRDRLLHSLLGPHHSSASSELPWPLSHSGCPAPRCRWTAKARSCIGRGCGNDARNRLFWLAGKPNATATRQDVALEEVGWVGGLQLLATRSTLQQDI